MATWRWLSGLVAFSWLWLWCCVSPSHGLALEYQESLKCQLRIMILKAPRYLWGGANDLEKGVDCSGYVFLAGKWAGIPGLKRTTAYRMALGLDGWTGADLGGTSGLLVEADECDLPFWTWRTSPHRAFGHVGVFLVGDTSGLLEVTHASSGRGRVVIQPLQGGLLRDLAKVRRLTIGDAPGQPAPVKSEAPKP